jgi:hypothetical protein
VPFCGNLSWVHRPCRRRISTTASTNPRPATAVLIPQDVKYACGDGGN